MNWLLAVIAAIVGAGLAESRNLFGAACSFVLVLGLFAIQKLRSDLEGTRRDLAAIKARLASAAIAAEARGPTPAPSAVSPNAPAPAAAAPERAQPAPVGPMLPDAAVRASATPPPVPTSAAASATIAGGASNERAASTPAPMPPPRPRAPATPGWEEVWVARIKGWFTEGNVPVKIGVLVLLFGVAAALRLAVANGYLSLSIEARLVVIAAAAVVGLFLGWRERSRRPAFGLSLQGGALGVLLLTVFAAYRLYNLLPSQFAFGLVVVLVAGSALLAVLQNTMSLAVLGFLGGYLAPVLISTGSHNHVALFSYYAVLNAAVFAISWRQSWRLLNLVGFVFTFGVGAAWGKEFYRPELFSSVEPFLVLFFVFYILIGLMYVLRQSEHRRPWVDGTLVFGTPLVAFPMQAAMLKDDRMGLAFSALVVALVYAGLVAWLRRQRGERLLTEAYAALALGFATLAVPLAFSASTTAGVWALEGAGAAWLGIRQNRNFPWLAGLGLQWLAAGAYVMSFAKPTLEPATSMLLLNPQWLGAAILSFSGFALALVHDRHRPVGGLPALLFAWAVIWWATGAIGQLDEARLTNLGQWPFSAIYLGASTVLACLLRQRLPWPRLDALLLLTALSGLILLPFAIGEYGEPLGNESLPGWALFIGAQYLALWLGREERSTTVGAAHLAVLWTGVGAISLQVSAEVDDGVLSQGWQFLAVTAPLAIATLALWRRARLLAWPRAEAFQSDYRMGWFAPAMLLLGSAFVIGSFMKGDAAPLSYLPLINPLELALVGMGALLFGLVGATPQLRPLREAWPLPALALVTLATLRAVHHLHGEPWSANILDSGFSQASLTVVWSLIGVSAWVLGSRRRNRAVWTGGAALMGIVLLKLILVDRTYMGNLPGIVSCLAVGLLLVGVGYVAPSPPRSVATGETT